jgi:hypothetical protein
MTMIPADLDGKTREVSRAIRRLAHTRVAYEGLSPKPLSLGFKIRYDI